MGMKAIKKSWPEENSQTQESVSSTLEGRRERVLRRCCQSWRQGSEGGHRGEGRAACKRRYELRGGLDETLV